jgi:hypothetical protein
MAKLRGSLWALGFVVFALFPLVVTNPTFTTIAVFTLIFMACTTS